MAENQAGIMALPDNQDMQKLSIFDSYDATNEALLAARPDAAQDLSAEMQTLKGVADELTDDQLDTLIEAIQYLYENKDEYAKNIAELAAAGAGDIFPPEYDPEFLATFNSILLEERKSRNANQAPPMKFALGGIAEAARIVANQGRNGDTMLAHITPEEARMLRRQGGSGTINPITGLPEYFNPFKKVVNLVKSAGKAIVGAIKSVASGVKKVLQSPVGKIAATIALTIALGPQGSLAMFSSSAAAAATASGAVTLASGGSVKDAFKSAAFAAIAAPDGIIGSYVGPTTQAWAGSNQFAKAAAEFGTSFAATTGAGLLTGENLNDAVKQGLTSAAISTGTSLAQGAIKDYKQSSELITQEAAKNKGFEQVAQDTAARNALETGTPFAPPRPSLLTDAGDVMKGGFAGSPSASPMQAAAIDAARNPAIPVTSSYTGQGPVSPVALSGQGPVTSSYTGYRPYGTDLGGMATYADDVAAGVAPVARGVAPDFVPRSPGASPLLSTSLKQVGGGIADIAKGDFKTGFGKIVEGGGDIFFPEGPSTAEIAAFEKANPNAPTAVKQFAAGPTAFRTYGPGVAAGLGIAGLSGAFDVSTPPKPEQQKLLEGTPGQDLIQGDPSKYIIQNQPGVTYTPEGQILSATDAPSTISMQDVRVAPAEYSATMQDVSRPTGSYAAAPMGPMQAQAPLMDPYQYYYQQFLASQGRPRYYAMGGITSLSTPPVQAPPPAGIAALREGGNSNYPRRTGQIAGPGTEKSDSIPAMLSDGEFVMTAAAVRGMGKGSRREGAKRMYALMHQLERNAARG